MPIGTSLHLFLFLWSFVALVLVLGYESLALEMTIMPVVEKSVEHAQDFFELGDRKHVTLYGDGYLNLKSADKYEIALGYETFSSQIHM